MLKLEMVAFGRREWIHPTLIWDDASAVDAGMPGMGASIISEILQAGVPLERLRSIIVTHQDIDHYGSVSELLQSLAQPINVYAHETDAPYLDGRKHPIKLDLQLVGERLKQLPEPVRTQVEAMCANPPKIHIDTLLTDGQELPLCGGITVIHTPGHTPGHMSLYITKSRALVAADALECENGILKGPNRHNTPDLAGAIQSLEKLLAFQIDRIICYHGGLCEDNAEDQLKQENE